MYLKAVRVAVLAIVLLAAASSCAEASWSVAMTAPKSAFIGGVSCPTADECWLDGGRRPTPSAAPGFHIVAPDVTIWNGRRFDRRRLPEPRGAKYVTLGPLSCLPGHHKQPFCMAVGTYWTTSSLKRNGSYAMAERLSDGHWSAERLPSPGLHSFRDALWNAISCASKRFCVAVGEETYPAEGFGPLMERYDGHRWTATRPAATNDLTGVSCPTVTFCLTVGLRITKVGELDTSFDTTPVALTRNGTAWSPATPPTDHLSAVDCANAGRCMGVGANVTYVPEGTYDSESDVAAAQSWRDGTWGASTQLGRSGSDSYLSALSCAIASVCSALGQSDVSSHLAPTALGFIGTGWFGEKFPARALTPVGISCPTFRTCMAVARTAAGRPVILHYRLKSESGSFFAPIAGGGGT